MKNKSIDEFDTILDDKDKDEKHELKRIASFEILDKLLNSCESNICPNFNEKDHYLLIDISISKYISDRAYFWGEKNEYSCDRDRQIKARERIEKVFQCKNICPKSADNLIINDDKDLLNNINLDCSKKRKAFWSFLSDRNRSAIANYHIASNFLANIQNGSLEKIVSKSIEENILLENSNIANGVDLYRFCFIRKINSSDTQM